MSHEPELIPVEEWDKFVLGDRVVVKPWDAINKQHKLPFVAVVNRRGNIKRNNPPVLNYYYRLQPQDQIWYERRGALYGRTS